MTQIELPTGISLIEEPLPAIRIDTSAASGVIYLNGAHVAEWTPAGQRPVLWMSQSSIFEPGKAIRGGVPLVWPWFGAGASNTLSPAHGFARIEEWQLASAQVSADGTASIMLVLEGQSVDASLAPDLPRDYRLEMHVTMGQTLKLQLVVVAGDQPLSFEEGLHTYFAVGDIAKVRVAGLDGAEYDDRLSDSLVVQAGNITFTGETDRIYESDSATGIVDDAWGREIRIEKSGSAQSVVWNPWIAKAAAMPDFGDDEWTQMVCVEAVNVRSKAITLQPNQRHELSQTISVG